MPLVPLDDPADPRLTDYRDLRDADLRRRGDAFVCEGRLVVERAVAHRWPLRSVLVMDSRVGDLPPLGPEVEVFVAPRAVLDAVVGFPLHRGIVAIAERRPAPAVEALLEGARTVAVLEGVNDAENLGALYRNAAAFGIDAVLLCPRCSDPLYRRSVRVSMGNVLHVPFTPTVAVPRTLEPSRTSTVVPLSP